MTTEQMRLRIAELEAALAKPTAKRRKAIPRSALMCACGVPLKNVKQQRKHDDFHRGRLHQTLSR